MLVNQQVYDNLVATHAMASQKSNLLATFATHAVQTLLCVLVADLKCTNTKNLLIT